MDYQLGIIAVLIYIAILNTISFVIGILSSISIGRRANQLINKVEEELDEGEEWRK